MKKIHFNTPIKALHRLKAAGFTEKQAEAQVEFVSECIESNFVTKQDLTIEMKDLRSEIKDFKSELRMEMSALKMEMKELEFRLTVKTATIVGSIVGFFSLLEKFLK